MSRYNTLIKEFPGGMQQIKFYSRCFDIPGSEAFRHSLLNPEFIQQGSFLKKETVSDPERSALMSVKRSIQKVYDIAHANDWTYFCTLTFDPKIVDSFNYDDCVLHLSRFTDLIHKCNVLSLTVPEQHDSGRWHFHSLLYDPDYVLPLVVNDHGYLSIENYKYGFTNISLIRDSHRAASYVLKYITKTFNVPPGKKRYWASKKLKRPHLTYDFESDEFFQKIYFEESDYNRSIYTKFCSVDICEIHPDNDDPLVGFIPVQSPLIDDIPF